MKGKKTTNVVKKSKWIKGKQTPVIKHTEECWRLSNKQKKSVIWTIKGFSIGFAHEQFFCQLAK